MRLPDIETVEECKHCGSTFGYYQKAFIKGHVQDITLFERDEYTNQREKYNHSIYDYLNWSKEKTTCYCTECDKPIGIKK